MSEAIRYRRDIDGMRALAVLPILLFHVGVTAVPGGFVGVDIFFVISGFLIGGIVINELRQDRFAFRNFWTRRVRRILPALAATLICTTIAATAVLLPGDLVSYAKSLIAAALSGANIYFQQTAGYFEQSAVDRPLLHLWSLGVEEQFYLFFPILIWALYRWARPLLIICVAVGFALSLLLSIYFVKHAPNAAFYLLPTRAWELLLGFGVTLSPPGPLVHSRLREAVAGSGALAMLASMLLLQATTPFPGVAALPACLGAAAVIAAGAAGSTLVSRILQARFLVWTGLISFSLYLWHWPIIVLVHYAVPAPVLAPAQQIAIIALTYLLAFLSWRFIEHPFRINRSPPRVVFAVAGLVVAGLCLIGGAIWAGRGFPSRFNPAAQRWAETLNYAPAPHFREGQCFLRPGQSAGRLTESHCVAPDADRPNVIVLGNSHAAHLWEGLKQVAPRVNVMQATGSGWRCVPLAEPHESPTCDGIWRYVFSTILFRDKVDLAVISATWEADELSELNRTLAVLHNRGIPVLLVAPGPQYQVPLPRLLAFAAQRHDPLLPERFSEASPRRYDRELHAIAQVQGAYFLSAYDALCHHGCPTVVDGMPLLFDVDHLTSAGSRRLALSIIATPVWPRGGTEQPIGR